MKYVLICIALFALVVAPAAFADSRDWTLKALDGESYMFSEHNDAPTLLMFWATWCVPCKKELTDHREFLEGLSAQGLNILLVAEDTQKTQSKVKPYVDSKGFPWTVLLDGDGELLKRFGGGSIPYSVLLDKTGESQMKIRGALSNTKALSAKVTELLGQTE